VIEVVRDWLPRQAFEEDAVRAALDEVVAAWSAAWISGAAARISAVRARRAASAPEPNTIQAKGRVASAELSPLGKRQLLEAVLGANLSMERLRTGDHKVLEALARQMIEDLTLRLDRAFVRAGPCAGEPELLMMLALAEREFLALAVHEHVLVPALRVRLGGANPASPVPHSRAKALGPMQLAIQAVLGRAELTMQELEGLGIGDVVVLDRDLNEPVELRLTGVESPLARGKLIRSGTHVSIQL
jgi:flagellar motor switch/type III secretory pathway protein FliN